MTTAEVRSELPPRLTAALAEVKALLVARFGPRLERVSLFGSWAWGRPHGDSDVDVCVVVDGLTHAEHVGIFELVAERGFERGVDLSPLAWSGERFRRGLATEQRIVRDIVERGISL